MKYVFVINPAAGNGRAHGEIVNKINLLSSPIDMEIYLTKGPKDATLFVKRYCELDPQEETCFVACGGDGTIEEVASGIVRTPNKLLAVYSCGSGNDFVKYYPNRDFTDISKLINGTKKTIDVMKVNDRYSINICNFGFDSIVASTANAAKLKGLSNPYGRGVCKAFFCGRSSKIKVVADNEEISRDKMLLCTLANGRFVGGKYFCSPKSYNDDGLIDVCLFHPMALLNCFLMIKSYEKGKHLDNQKYARHLEYRQVRHVEISSTQEFEICIDGEMLSGKKFDVNVLNNALNILLPSV